jgi:hypothetical protein
MSSVFSAMSSSSESGSKQRRLNHWAMQTTHGDDDGVTKMVVT